LNVIGPIRDVVYTNIEEGVSLEIVESIVAKAIRDLIAHC